jgi:DNA-directed RNA polymerase specialized sigma24 family protein
VGQFNDALVGGFAPGSPTVLRGNGHKDSDTAWDGVLAPEEQFRPPSDLPPSDQFRRDEEASRVSVHSGSAERLDDNADPDDAVIEGDATRPKKHHALPAQSDIGWQDPTFDECLSDLVYDAIELAIDRLAESDPEAHQVFDLDRRDWTQPKIAAEVGVSVRTVRRRFKRAREQLQTELEPFRHHLMLDHRYGTERHKVSSWGKSWSGYSHLGSARREIPLQEREDLWAWRVRFALDGTPNELGEKRTPDSNPAFF